MRACQLVPSPTNLPNSLKPTCCIVRRYIQHQRVIDQVCQQIIGPDPEHTVIVFGDGAFSSTSKGFPPCPVKRIRRRLRHFTDRVKSMDEFRTTKTCNRCHAWTEDHPRAAAVWKIQKPRHGRRYQRQHGGEIHDDLVIRLRKRQRYASVKSCNRCFTFWHRDVNSVLNMTGLALYELR